MHVAARNARCRLGTRRLAVLAGAMLISFAHGQASEASPSAEPPAKLTAEARAFENGEGVPKDPIRAAQLYCEAARGGDPEAMFGLGWMYANGRGVDRDDALAASLFARAASYGHDYARRMLKFVGSDEGVVPACLLPPRPQPAPATTSEAADPFAALPPSKSRIADVVRLAAPGFGIDPQLALAIAAVESDFEPAARSIKDARGVMQLVSGTAVRFNVANRMDIAANVRGGLAYLQWLLAYYEGRVRLAVAAYNAGEGAVDRYGGVPPYQETRDYVRRVLALFPNESQPYDPSVAEPSPAFARADIGGE